MPLPVGGANLATDADVTGEKKIDAAVSQPTLSSPVNASTVSDNTPTLVWNAVTDNNGPVTYRLEVDNESTFAAPLVVNQTGLSATSYTVPSSLADDTYYWRVTATDSLGNASPASDIWLFVLAADNTAPTVSLSSPNGGESFAGGSTQSIIWSATDTVGVTAINLSYSSDGGTSWTSIATGETNDGAYSWTVPSINSSQVLVKVEAEDAAGNVGFDASDGVFTISVITVVTVNAPAGVKAGEYFTVDIDILLVTDFDAADFNVVFDSAVLAIDDITPGVDITDGEINTTTIPVVQTFQVDANTVRILVNVTGTPGVTGSGYLSQIRFQAIGNAGDSSDIDLASSMSDNTGAAIPAAWEGDSINLLEHALGDTNGDGVLNASDLTLLERMVVGAIATTPEADINQDGVFNAQDITLMEILLVGGA